MKDDVRARERAPGGTVASLDRVAVRRVLVSVHDKAHLAGLVRALAAALPAISAGPEPLDGLRLYASGGTQAAIAGFQGDVPGARVEVVAIPDYTGFPEMPGGLVKTLHPRIHAGILAETGSPEQDRYLAEIGAEAFDMVVCNLYPFEEVAATPGATIEDLRRNIDIGGPTMIRAAAKNFLRVGVLVDPVDYGPVGAEVVAHGGLSLATRLELARKAFARVRDYDEAICRALAGIEAVALQRAYGMAR